MSDEVEAICVDQLSLHQTRPLNQLMGCKVQGSGFRIQGSGFRVQGSEVRIHGSGLGSG